MITLNHSVGGSGKNRPVDVMIVQHLLNLNHGDAGLVTPLPVTGDVDSATAAAILSFQGNAMGKSKPDGRVDPGGTTLAKLAKPIKTGTTHAVLRAAVRASMWTTPVRPGEVSSALSIIDSRQFLALYDRQFVQLGASARTGLGELIGFINDDLEITDVGWCAYMLATVKHECAERWKPIREFGQGSGKAYGKPVVVTDADGNKHTNAYYGRGYVQLTWKDNYANLGKALDMVDDLLINPDLALEPETAYEIMSYGMRTGSFTGKSLGDYINQNQCNYPSARQIINALDQHMRIAGYAADIELLLRVSCNGSVSDSTF